MRRGSPFFESSPLSLITLPSTCVQSVAKLMIPKDQGERVYPKKDLQDQISARHHQADWGSGSDRDAESSLHQSSAENGFAVQRCSAGRRYTLHLWAYRNRPVDRDGAC